VDEQELGVGERRQRRDVRQQRLVGFGVIEGDQDASIHATGS
jgi:hypothetical protein